MTPPRFAVVYDVQRYNCTVVSLHLTQDAAERAKGKLPERQDGKRVLYEVFGVQETQGGYPKPGERALCNPVHRTCERRPQATD